MRFRILPPAALPGKLVLAITVIAVSAAIPLIAFVMAHGYNLKGDRVASGYTASRHFSGVPGPTAGAGLPVIALGIGAYWLVRRQRRKSEAGLPEGDLKD